MAGGVERLVKGVGAEQRAIRARGFDGGGNKTPKKAVTEAHIREVLEDGDARLLRKEAAEKLQKVASVGRTVADNALKTEGGEFSRILHKREDRTLALLGS